MEAASRACAAPRLWPDCGPFDLDDGIAYRAWRDEKLAHYPAQPADIHTEIRDPARLSAGERAAIAASCARANLALYSFSPHRDEQKLRGDLLSFGVSLGLTALEDHRSAEADGIVRIERSDAGGRAGYIPYTDRPISWHTDGYYNFHGAARYVQAMLLHCVRDAPAGGENRLLDPEIAYIRLRDVDPALVAALMNPQAMTIPANVEADGRVRPANTGPVFFVDPATGALGMRFTARKRNISWRDDAATQRAVAALMMILESEPLRMEVRLAPGQGLICNNVLHDRTGFEADLTSRRLLFRIRYHGRIVPAAHNGS